MIGYQYDANGSRVGKGTVTNWQSCDITQNGYTPTTDFVLDPSGGQMTELAVYTTSAGTQYQHVHSNVSAGGALIASFDSLYNQHYYLTDALGSRRVQTDAAGIPVQTCQSLPFGDQLLCTGGSLATPTEHHFTGKERDTESGLDYFGARYYASSMGRWMSPDWSAQEDPVPYAKLDDPQTLNLYSYVYNQPVTAADPDGHCPPCEVASFASEAASEVAVSPAGQAVEQATAQAFAFLGGAALAVAAQGSGILNNIADHLASGPAPSIAGNGWDIGQDYNKASAPARPATAATASKPAPAGPKASDAPGVTAGGQATDKHGNKLGPSSKPQVNTTKSSTRKGADDKAKSEGSGSVEHSNPKVGNPHFHPTDAKGNKKPTSTHHEYPKK